MTRPPSPAPQPSCADTCVITGHFAFSVRDPLKILAIKRGKTVQAVIKEALNNLFASHGMPPIAPSND